MPLGMTNAVIFFSRLVMSYMGIESFLVRQWSEDLAGKDTYVCYPSKYVGMETYMVFRDVKPALNEDFPLQSTAIVCHG
jgi:hypothetical protein